MRILLLVAIFFTLTTFPVSAHTGHPHQATDSANVEISIEDEVIPEENLLPHLSQVTIYILIALAGIAVGSLATFLLLTTTLHPKR